MKEVQGLVDFVIERVKVSILKFHPRNYRHHPPGQLAHIVESIREHGLYRNVVTANDYTVLAGHGVVMAVRELGIEEIPIYKIDIHPDHPRAIKLMAGDNEISRLGEIDDRTLSEILKLIHEEDSEGLKGTGFDEKMLANLLFITRPKSEIKDMDEAREWVGLPPLEDAIKDMGNRIIVHFRSNEDRFALSKLINIPITEATTFIWYPQHEIDDLVSLRFVNQGDESYSHLNGSQAPIVSPPTPGGLATNLIEEAQEVAPPTLEGQVS